MNIKLFKKIAPFLTAVFLVAACVQGARAISGNAGTSGAQFLKIGAGSRAAGMAETYVAMADDVYSGYYNPAGLTRMTAPEFAGQHVSYFQDTNYEFVSFAVPFDRQQSSPMKVGQEKFSRQALSLSIYNLSVNDIERRTGDTVLAAGLFDSSDMAYAVSYARRLMENVGVGGTFKYIRKKIDTVSAWAVAVDLGVQYHPFPDRPLDIGLSIRNLGSKLKYEQGSDPLPLGGVFGLAYSFAPGLKIGADFVKYRDTDFFVSVGGEYSREFMKNFSGALRGGYTTHYKDIDGLKGIAGGAGIRYARLNLDFAWVPFGDLGNTFRYTLSVRF